MPAPRKRKKSIIIAVAVVAVIAVSAIAGYSILRNSDTGLGRALMVAQGQIVSHEYAKPAALPAAYAGSPGSFL